MSSERPRGSDELLAEFGQIDIYVFDQLLRGQITSSMRVLDAGCGAGRNSEYLMRCGTEIYGVDSDANQIARIRDVASKAAPGLSPEHFRVARLDDLPFPDAHFDAVICSAVLHFSNDAAEFENAVSEMWRVLRPGGVFFARLASTIGLEGRVTHLRDRWYHLPDGSDRFLVDENYLLGISSDLGARQLDPLKTTVVQDMRSMTTWVLRKP
ncbi:MAG: class I SAM-dependent methyltransferase [Gemmatimonadetes bacterium]|nr:class I SAM-dependent methyltransferase [Gemmatimonadota bacterium]